MNRDTEAYEQALSALLAGEATPASTADDVEAGTPLGVLRVLGAIHRTSRTIFFGSPAETPAAVMWGHLEIRAEIGRGASGTVYRAWDTRLAREVALKLIDPDSASADAALAEGRLLAQLRHPNVVTVYGADTCNGVAGLWMELVQGDTLDDLVRRDGAFSIEEALLVGIELAQALAAVHGAGMLHRDVKARNVVRQQGGRLVLMDFGAGRAEASTAASDGAGTPLYMAPEVLAGAPASVQSDVYGLGVLLYYLVTCTYPVTAPDLAALRAAHGAGRRHPIGSGDGDVPAAARAAIDRALATDPAERFAIAPELEGALTDALRAVLAERAPVVPAALRRWRRWRRPVLATAVTLLTLSLATLAGWNTMPGRSVRRAFALPVPPRSPLYFAYGGGIGMIDGRTFRIFDGGSGGSLALAASRRHGIRTMPSSPSGVPGAWFGLNGQQQPPVVDSDPILCCYLDGTTDGRFNYALRQDQTGVNEPIGSRPLAPPAIHRFDLDWRHRETLFELGQASANVTSRLYFGIAYHEASDTFWVTRLEGDGTAHVEHWSRDGRRVASHQLAPQSRAIAVDPADGTAWTLRYTPNDTGLHFDNVDRAGRRLGTYSIPQPVGGVGNAGMEFAWPDRQ